MDRVVQILGRPRVRGGADGDDRMRSRKSWALLTFLLAAERPPSRAQLASLLFASADDPLGALRWCLAEIRRSIGAEVGGDPVVLRMPAGITVDADVVLHRPWTEALALPTLGAPLLEGVVLHDADAWESWLLAERYRVAAATESVLHEAALGFLARGALDDAIACAVRLLTLTPLDENHHALLIRLYRLAGNDAAAERQFAECAGMLERELGIAPGAVVRAALREVPLRDTGSGDAPSTRAALEAGRAAVSAGAIQTGVDVLRSAVRLADGAGDPDLRTETRLVLAEALIHSLRGFDEEGSAALHEADRIAESTRDRASIAATRAELGYVDFLRGRYDRARERLSESARLADGAATSSARARVYLGCVASDQAHYASALAFLTDGIRRSRDADDTRQAAYGLSMLGRMHLLRGELDVAAEHLDAALALTSADRWLAFLPWPQALRGEVDIARGDIAGAADALEQAFARACRLGDPCWEGIAARGLALVADARGEGATAFGILADARKRANRLTDPYLWLDARILDTQCTLGLRHGHRDTDAWIDALTEVSSRSGMRELRVRALVHGAARGRAGDAAAARLLAAEIDSPVVGALVADLP